MVFLTRQVPIRPLSLIVRLNPVAGVKLIFLFVRDNTSHSTLWILYVPLTSRYEMDMDMRYGLTSGLTCIHTNIKPFDSQIIVLDTAAHCDQHLMNTNKLEFSQVEVINNVSFRNN